MSTELQRTWNQEPNCAMASHSCQRQLWRRKPWFECGCFDPCRCDYRDNPSQKRIDAYRDAIGHLAAEGLLAAALAPELRQLWRRGGSDRQVAENVVRRWAA